MSDNINMNRVKQNIAALKSLRSNTPNAQLLKNYTGWGGLRDAVYTPDIYRQLKTCVSNEELVAIKQTLKTAYYTPTFLVNALYQLLDHYLTDPKHLLEPSAGHGVFLEHVPTAWQSLHITAVEIDSVSCQLLQALYPNATIVHQGFEQFESQPIFDVVVGNPPFGQMTVTDKQHPDISAYSIHHFFVAKAMRLLKKDGYLAMILPRYFLDASQKHVRGIIAEEGGSLIEAYRLPDDLFCDAKVTTDLVLLQKKPSSRHWVKALPYIKGNQRASLNEYFHEQPQHIFGQLVFVEMYGRSEITCQSSEGDLIDRLKQAVSKDQLSLPQCRAYLSGKLDQLERDMQAIKNLHDQTQTLLSALDDNEHQRQQLCEQVMRIIKDEVRQIIIQLIIWSTRNVEEIFAL